VLEYGPGHQWIGENELSVCSKHFQRRGAGNAKLRSEGKMRDRMEKKIRERNSLKPVRNARTPFTGTVLFIMVVYCFIPKR